MWTQGCDCCQGLWVLLFYVLHGIGRGRNFLKLEALHDSVCEECTKALTRQGGVRPRPLLQLKEITRLCFACCCSSGCVGRLLSQQGCWRLRKRAGRDLSCQVTSSAETKHRSFFRLPSFRASDLRCKACCPRSPCMSWQLWGMRHEGEEGPGMGTGFGSGNGVARQSLRDRPTPHCFWETGPRNRICRGT